MDVIFLTPHFREKVWGGEALKDFGYALPSDHTGEAWVISAYKDNESIVKSPEAFKGMTLRELYDKHPEVFGEVHHEPFPLLVKILDASDDLSVQVHPDDIYAAEHENDLGKSESWYILSAKPHASIVYGHTAKTREEFEEKVKAGDWEHLLRRLAVHEGEFYDVPHGMIHALGEGVVVLETQQSSDTTYRVYDYDRPDQNGKLRELHLPQVMDVTDYPAKYPSFEPKTKELTGGKLTFLLKNPAFSVWKWEATGGPLNPSLIGRYTLGTVVEGKGEMTVEDKTYSIQKGDAFIIPNEAKHVQLDGKVTIITSYESYDTEE